MAVSSKQSEVLRTYEFAASFLLRAYATDEVTREANNDVRSFHQSSAMTKEHRSDCYGIRPSAADLCFPGDGEKTSSSIDYFPKRRQELASFIRSVLVRTITQ